MSTHFAAFFQSPCLAHLHLLTLIHLPDTISAEDFQRALAALPQLRTLQLRWTDDIDHWLRALTSMTPALTITELQISCSDPAALPSPGALHQLQTAAPRLRTSIGCMWGDETERLNECAQVERVEVLWNDAAAMCKIHVEPNEQV